MLSSITADTISIHALLAESDLETSGHKTEVAIFLSTLSLRRATPGSKDTGQLLRYFYPRSPCGERRRCETKTLRGERFLSTLSLRRATRAEFELSLLSKFLSTLSLRRATLELTDYITLDCDFYPRSPCGERHTIAKGWDRLCNFYPRSPCGERLICNVPQQHKVVISIHALLAESDTSSGRRGESQRYFYPRSPCGERRSRSWSLLQT